MERFILPAILLAFLVLLGLRTRGRNKAVSESREAFLKKHVDEIGFLCSRQEEIDKGLVQLYGGMVGKVLKPGDELIGFQGRKYRITEVYADKDTPEKPSVEMPTGDFDCALVLKSEDWDYSLVDEMLKKDTVVLFRIG